MDLELEGRRALVTASSAGIGAAVADRLAREGCAVLVHGRHPDRAERVAGELRRHGVPTDVVLGDLADDSAAEHVAGVAREWGPDILVNNAGPFAERGWDETDAQTWRDTYEANDVSAVRLIRELTPGMAERGWGRVINVGTRGVRAPLPNMVDYSAAKAALVNLTVSLAQHLSGTGVTANTVSPGVILTDGVRRMIEARRDGGGAAVDQAEEERRFVDDYAPNPTGRLGTGRDIAAVVAFLASPSADYVNGVNLPVDGGISGIA
jgi:NAD(P)-dependent dehydrogenase (short-subunit alcohol dehydrogenase family)